MQRTDFDHRLELLKSHSYFQHEEDWKRSFTKDEYDYFFGDMDIVEGAYDYDEDLDIAKTIFHYKHEDRYLAVEYNINTLGGTLEIYECERVFKCVV
jgi:hypothetical protein